LGTPSSSASNVARMVATSTFAPRNAPALASIRADWCDSAPRADHHEAVEASWTSSGHLADAVLGQPDGVPMRCW
jgi:hypothetical protein